MKFLVGSKYFFNKFNDYNSKDTDWVIIEDNPQYYTNTMTMRGRGEDLMFFKNRSKQEFINMTLSSNLPMVVGKFLIPEFNEYIGFTIDDLILFEHQFNKMDDKHLYEKYIYECYLVNKKFTLTESQLEEAYKIYKKYSKKIN